MYKEEKFERLPMSYEFFRAFIKSAISNFTRVIVGIIFARFVALVVIMTHKG